MNKDGHTLINFYVFLVLLASGMLKLLGNNLNIFIFSLVYVLFTTELNPDIDIKLPGIAHRKITHDIKWQIVILIALGVLIYLLMNYIKIEETSLIAPILLGILISWNVHTITDWIYDRVGWITWIILIILITYVGILLRS